MKEIFLSVIIPAYNESSVIENTLRQITSHFESKTYAYEIIVVNDASTDDTEQKVLGFCKHNEKVRLLSNKINVKKGASVKKGVLSARGKYVSFIDADYVYPIHQIDNFLNKLENGADIVIGNRMDPLTTFTVKPEMFHYVYRRFLVGRLFNFLVRLFIIDDINDTQCGIKCFRKDVAIPIFSKMNVSNFAFDIEFLHIAQKNRERIAQMPVLFNYVDEPSSVKLFKDSLRMMNSLMQIRINSWLGKYR